MNKIKVLLFSLVLVIGGTPLVHADNALYDSDSQQLVNASNSQQFISRGEAIHGAVMAFDLQNKNSTFISMCLTHLDDCFFVFTSMTRYNQVSLHGPMQLYPDVPEAYKYAPDINLATMLGLVRGNIEAKDSPFCPRAYISRIHALKVVLAASGLIDWREKFELVRDLGSEDALRAETTPFPDVTAIADDDWWYPRYVNFALDVGVIDAGQYFRPDEPITFSEYSDMLNRALKASVTAHAATNTADTQEQPSGNSSQQTVN